MQLSSVEMQTSCWECATRKLFIRKQNGVHMQIMYWVDANRKIQNYQKNSYYITEMKDFACFGLPNILNRTYILIINYIYQKQVFCFFLLEAEAKAPLTSVRSRSVSLRSPSPSQGWRLVRKTAGFCVEHDSYE